MGSFQKLIKGIALVGQIGFSIMTPPVIMAILGYWLTGKTGAGPWLTVVFIIVGLAASASTAYSFYRKAVKRSEKDGKEKAHISFRDHI